MELSQKTAKEILAMVNGERREDQTPAEYISDTNRKLMMNMDVGFTEYHAEINQYLKKVTDNKVWHLVCAHISGYEKYWVKALKEFIITNYPKSTTW